MKTKHLLMAAALPLAFAACSNEEFEGLNNTPEFGEERPLVDVTLNFERDDSRAAYDGSKYEWTADDRFGALLMDEVVSSNRPYGTTAEYWNKETWLQHYGLVDYINTAYPFSWATTNGVTKWTAPSKLQEGNYFFVSPYDTYDGERQHVHYLTGQKQTGGTVAAKNEAIGKNQYFVGYAQIKASKEEMENLTNISMARILAPIEVTLRNIGTQAKHIEKVVVYSSSTETNTVASALTLDPTDATYGGTDLLETSATYGEVNVSKQTYNLGTNADKVGSTTNFNYANFIGAEEDEFVKDGGLVYNVPSGATDYSRGDAIAQVVKPLFFNSTPASYEKQAVLTFTAPVEIPADNGEVDFAIMVNPISKVNTGDLLMDIIFTEGQITGIDLTTKKESETMTLGANTVLNNKAITSLKPSVKNQMIMQFDNNSVVKDSEINVSDEDILLSFIEWNKENYRLNTATLLKDVKFTKAMYDALKESNGKLAIKNAAPLASADDCKLLVADDVPVDVLNLIDKTSDAVVVLNGERTLSKTVAAGLNGAAFTVENQGILTISEANVVAYRPLNNYGTIKVAAAGELYGTSSNNILNYGTIENLGDIYNVQNKVGTGELADFKGYVKLGNGANHIVANDAEATIEFTAISADQTLTGMTTPTGIIYYKANNTTVYGTTLATRKINKLEVVGTSTVDIDAMQNTVEDLIINGNVTLKGWSVPYASRTATNLGVSEYKAFKALKKVKISGTVELNNAGLHMVAATGEMTIGKVGKACDVKVVTKSKLTGTVTFVKGATLDVTSGAELVIGSAGGKVYWNGNTVKNMGTTTYGVTDPANDVIGTKYVNAGTSF